MGARTWLSRSAVPLALLNPARAADFEFDIEQLSELSPPPGGTISADNLGLYNAFIDRDFARFVESGAATLMIGEPLSFRPPDAYIEATARCRGHARLGDNPGVLDGYKQGRPFSGALDTNDPTASTKAAWNMRYVYTGDSGKLAEIRWQMRDWKSQKVQVEMLFEGRSMRLRYRHVQLPVPAITNNPHDTFAAFYMQIDPAAHKARQLAYWHVDFGGHGGCFPKVQWQLRPTLILQATALDPAAVVTRRVFYRANLYARHVEDLSRRATTVEVCYQRLRPSRFS